MQCPLWRGPFCPIADVLARVEEAEPPPSSPPSPSLLLCYKLSLSRPDPPNPLAALPSRPFPESQKA